MGQSYDRLPRATTTFWGRRYLERVTAWGRSGPAVRCLEGETAWAAGPSTEPSGWAPEVARLSSARAVRCCPDAHGSAPGWAPPLQLPPLGLGDLCCAREWSLFPGSHADPPNPGLSAGCGPAAREVTPLGYSFILCIPGRNTGAAFLSGVSGSQALTCHFLPPPGAD